MKRNIYFNGKRYQFLTSFYRKTKAKKHAKLVRSVGAKPYVRIIKGKTAKGNTIYRLYTRKK